MKRRIQLTGVLLLLVGVLIFSRKISRRVSETASSGTAYAEVVLDAGHGGADPGKVGINGSREKDLNLEITKRIENLLKEENISCRLTRTNDATLAADNSERQKVADMKERVRIINETGPEIAVSIHQNSYPDASVKGAQVFYYTHSKKGEAAAKTMQDALKMVDESNHREAKANDTYYLLKKTEPATVIVECGFLSNPAEAQKLQEKEYQEKIARAVVSGIKSYLAANGTKSMQ